MLSEFDLIKQYFTGRQAPDARIGLGIGDDCALLTRGDGMRLAISTDMLVENRHFFAGAEPFSLGHKCLAVNLSDLAAMGATPLAFTLALALPDADRDWLDGFSKGLFSLADRYGCQLIGGDTTKGPLTISITIFGEVPANVASLRSAALPGDDVWVSGTLGDARLALAAIRNEFAFHDALQDRDLFDQASLRMHRPTPRVALGIALRGIAHAAIDISDGLAGDLGHVLQASRCGASIDVDALPAGGALRLQPLERRRAWTLSGGDDYELCFTAPVDLRADVQAAAAIAATPVTRIGTIDATSGLRLYDAQGLPLALAPDSFDHFRTT